MLNVVKNIGSAKLKILMDKSRTYVKDGHIIKNRRNRTHINIGEEIINYNNIIIESNNRIDIYCNKDFVKHYQNIVRMYEGGMTTIIKIHCEYDALSHLIKDLEDQIESLEDYNDRLHNNIVELEGEIDYLKDRIYGVRY